MTKEKFIIGIEGCPACEAMEGYFERVPKPGMKFFKIREADPRGKEMLGLMEEAGLDPEGFPFCVEEREGKMVECSIEPLMNELNAYVQARKEFGYES